MRGLLHLRLAGVLALAACATNVQDAPPGSLAGCLPVEGSLAAGEGAAALVGEYRLTLVATRGERAGSRTMGALELRAYPPGAGPAGLPAGLPAVLHGATGVELVEVGAVAAGAPDAMDPAAPGVLVLEWSGDTGPEIALRLGADANRGGPPRFDGASMALFVQRITAAGFRGRWESGVGEPGAAGHFCAERSRPSGSGG